MTRASQSGSIFLETVIAAAIVAGAALLVTSVAGDGVVRSRSMEMKSKGLVVAQSKLAAIGYEIPLAAGVASGMDGPFIWRVSIIPYRLGQAKSSAGNVYQVSVAVRSRNAVANLIELRSLRLAPMG